MSVMEMSHRGKPFDSIAKKAEADLRELMNIPEDYHVIFMQGGATALFAAICLNLTQVKLVTRRWIAAWHVRVRASCSLLCVPFSRAGGRHRGLRGHGRLVQEGGRCVQGWELCLSRGVVVARMYA